MRRPRWLLTGGLVALLMVTAAPTVQADTTLERVPGLERIKAVAAAGPHFAALRADGSVWTWDDSAGSLAATKPQQVSISCSVRSLAAGADRVAMVCSDGTVWTADFSISDSGAPRAQQVPGLDSIKAVALARSGLVAVRTDGTVWISEHAINTKGAGTNGRMVSGLSGVTAVAAGIDDFVAVMANGTAARMAINTKGTGATLYTDLPAMRSVADCGPGSDCDASDPYVFTTVSGKVVARISDASGAERTVPIGDLDRDGYIAAGHDRILSVRSTGDVRMAVLAADGTATVTDIKLPGPPLKQVATGASHDLGLAADGMVYAWAISQRPSPSQVQGLQDITTIASGGQWHLALAASGKLFCWGSNDPQAHEIAHTVQQVSSIAAAPDFYVTLQTDGSVAAGVCPPSGAPPAEPVIQRDIAARSIAAGDKHVTLIKFDDQVAVAEVAITAAGVQFGDLQAVSGLDGAVQVAATETGYLVLRADGTVWGALWGQTPVQVKDVAGARAIAGGGSTYAVLLGDGTASGIAIDEQGVHVWGDPHVAQSDVAAACCSGGQAGGGSGGAIVSRADGTVVTFTGTAGATPVDGLTDVIAVSGGATENLALKGDGTVWRFRSGVGYWK